MAVRKEDRFHVTAQRDGITFTARISDWTPGVGTSNTDTVTVTGRPSAVEAVRVLLVDRGMGDHAAGCLAREAIARAVLA